MSRQFMLMPPKRDFDSRNPRHYAGRRIDSHWIDSNLLRQWKHKCDSHRGKYCGQGPAQSRLASFRPAWLIDTWRLCLVPGDIGAPYVALSYVWGTAPFFKTCLENVTQLQLDRAFSDCHAQLGVPRTIEHAIAVVGLLEQRYLWVDALCVVQDDEVTRQNQINNMASIFCSASLTIIAKQSENANHGLPGLQDISRPRNINQETFGVGEGRDIMLLQLQNRTTQWSKRGWTFQEALFSQRCLVFDNECAWWEYGCSSFAEDSEPHPGGSAASYNMDFQNRLFSATFPCLSHYGTLVMMVNDRDLTHPEDALDAFAGITTALTSVLYGGFLYGLPLLFFDVALCWQPQFTCERRLPSSDSAPTVVGSSLLVLGWIERQNLLVELDTAV